MLDLVFDAISELADSAEDLVPTTETNDFDGVDNGIFEGDENDLTELSEVGMIEGTDHIDSDDLVRNIAARNDFLSSIGLDSIPEGYEVHHIIPLSEGGADDPSNMVLLTHEEHAQITAAHRNFYEWNS